MLPAADTTTADPIVTWQHLDPSLAGILTTVDGSVSRLVDAGDDSRRLAVRADRPVVTLRLAREPGERFHGMGERFGASDLRGQVLLNRADDGMGRPGASTSYSPSPFLLSSRGYGLVLNTTATARVDLVDPRAVTITVEGSDLTVEVLTGPDPGAVVRAHARRVGLPPVPPPWGLGVWKSLIGGTARVLGDAERLRAAGVPLDAVWVYDVVDPASGFGWSWPIHDAVPPGPYPDPAALVADLHRRGLAVLGYLTPFAVVGRPGYDEAAAAGHLVTGADGRVVTEPWMGERRAYLDLTDPAAIAWWQARVRHALGVVGFDGAMQDYGERAPLDGRYADGRPGALVRNDYPVLYARAARDAAEQAKPGGTVLFARSGYDGTQALATGRFTGDQTRDWDPATGLPSVLAGMLDGSVSGWPYWGPDIGGFLDGAGARDRELWTRWVQLGAFSPVMRDMLGAMTDPVGALTDAGTTATFARYATLHRAMQPALLAAAAEAHRTGTPIMRPLWFDEPSDPDAWRVQDEYRLGPDLVVAPVLRQGVTSRPVHVPPGRWRDHWSGRVLTGPATVEMPAPVEEIPLLERAGSAPFGVGGPDR